jgi:transcriptional regulator GlxA family with amidase domain
MPTSIAIFLFEDAEELDWAGPWEVLAAWMQFHPDEVQVFTVVREEGPIRCAKGLRVLADYTWSDAPEFDVLIYPGGQGTRAHLGDDEIKSWLHKSKEGGVLMTSVCTGALVYADVGLLDNRPATTHWASLDLLESLGESIEVRKEDRYVDDGDVITAAGVSAGIDMALHLVERLQSTERAKEVRRYIQYDPDPPV